MGRVLGKTTFHFSLDLGKKVAERGKEKPRSEGAPETGENHNWWRILVRGDYTAREKICPYLKKATLDKFKRRQMPGSGEFRVDSWF